MILETTANIPGYFIWGGVALLAMGIFVYANLVRQLLRAGGKVNVEKLGPAELVIAMFIITWFGVSIARTIGSPRTQITAQQIQSASSFFILVVIFLGSFLHFRGISLREFFGLSRVKPLKLLGHAVGLLLSALPMLLAVSLLTRALLGSKAQSQEIVDFFVQANRNGDHHSMLVVGLLGVVVAPIVEEFIFRGFLYSVFKRHLGMLAAVVFNAALFAAIHVNAGSLAALFVLAVTFTLAYELTGSLLVPMTMHALFNFSSLGLLFLASHAVP